MWISVHIVPIEFNVMCVEAWVGAGGVVDVGSSWRRSVLSASLGGWGLRVWPRS